MARRYSPRALVLQLSSRGLTQAQIARKVGRSARTVRRWKSGDAEPSDDALRRLERAARAYREENRRAARRVSRGAQPIPRDVPIPKAERRQLKRYRGGKDTGECYASDWLNYNVRGYSVGDVIELIESLWDQGAHLRLQVQLIFSTRLDDQIYWTESRKAKRRERSTGRKRAASVIQDLGGIDRSDVAAFVRKWLDGAGRVPLYVGVLDVQSGRIPRGDDFFRGR